MLTQAICNSFRAELLRGEHNFQTDFFKFALFRATAAIVGTFDANTTNYSQMGLDELVAAGYVAGGKQALGGAVSLAGGKGLIDFSDVSWPNVTFTSRGAMLYNVSRGGAAVAVWDFGLDRTVVQNSFSLQMPPATAAAALLRTA